MKDTASKPATPGQIIEIGNALFGSVIKLLQERNISFDQAKKLIEEVGKRKITETANKVAEKLLELAVVDVTFLYRKDLEAFFFKIYGVRIPSDIIFPKKNGYNHYMVVPPELSNEVIFNSFEKVRLSNFKNVLNVVKETELLISTRPTTLYAFAHKGEVRPDRECLGQSYSEYSTSDQDCVTLKEYMLIYQFMFWKFAIRLDVNSWTRTPGADPQSDLMTGGWGDGFWLNHVNHLHRRDDAGPRVAVLS